MPVRLYHIATARQISVSRKCRAAAHAKATQSRSSPVRPSPTVLLPPLRLRQYTDRWTDGAWPTGESTLLLLGGRADAHCPGGCLTMYVPVRGTNVTRHSPIVAYLCVILHGKLLGFLIGLLYYVLCIGIAVVRNKNCLID